MMPNVFAGIKKLAPRKITPQKIVPQKIAPYESSPPVKIAPQNFPPEKIVTWENSPPGKITLNEIPSPLINHTNERKNKITKFFALKNAMQHNILIKITKAFFDTQMISQKNTGLRYFLYRMKKIQIYQLSLYVTLWI